MASGLAATKVHAANTLYALTSEVMAYATRHGILCANENPSRSLAWQTSYGNRFIAMDDPSLHAAHFHRVWI